MSDPVLYTEEESFSPLLTVLTLTGVAIFLGIMLISRPAESFLQAMLVVQATIILLFALNAYQLRIVVQRDRVYLRLGRILPLWWKTIRLSDIESVTIVKLTLWRRNAGVHLGRFQGRCAVKVLTGGPRAVYIERKKG